MEIVDKIGNFGILVVIAGIFLYEHFTSNKKTQTMMEQNSEMLKEMKNTNENTAKALEIIQENQAHTIKITEGIDKKIDCIKEKANISKIER